jgi:hypothetical protein
LGQFALACGAFAALALAYAPPTAANWLSRLAHGVGEVGEVGLKAGSKIGVAALEGAAGYVARLPKLGKGSALAAHMTPEGHWKFVNREGEVFTAATPDELARMRGTLAPDTGSGDRLALYLSDETVFERRAALKDLPPGADLYVVSGKNAYRLGEGATTAEIRPNVTVALDTRGLFEEAVFHLGRPLNRSNIRVLALEPGGPKRLTGAPRYDPASKAALVDQIDPTSLSSAFGSIKGQTALVSGRIEGDVLVFRPASGGEQKIDLKSLVAAAETSDVNLVFLETGTLQQPGGLNWLWQKVAVAGLDEALERSTFADFLSSLAGAGTDLSVTAAAGSPGRIVLQARPVASTSDAVTGTLGDWASEITGHVVVKAVQVYARDEAREQELDARIVPGIPAGLQFAYLGAIIAGILSHNISAGWWGRLWPPEERAEYASGMGYWAARVVRVLAYVLVFLPIVGMPALLWSMVLQIWGVLTAPVRAWAWLRARLGSRSA